MIAKSIAACIQGDTKYGIYFKVVLISRLVICTQHIPTPISMSGGEGMVSVQTRAGGVKVIKVICQANHQQKQALAQSDEVDSREKTFQ